MENNNNHSKENPLYFPPEYQQIMEKFPEEAGIPENAVCYAMRTEAAMCVLLSCEVSEEAAMPFDNPSAIIDNLHSSMNEEQGIIEVESGVCKGGGKYVYYILKYPIPSEDNLPLGNGYLLNLNLQKENTVQFINATFEELGMTGLRDSMVFSLFCRADKGTDKEANETDIFTGWAQDPYDPEYTKGYLKNVSENSDFDDQFPEHPLSEARSLVRYIIDNN